MRAICICSAIPEQLRLSSVFGGKIGVRVCGGGIRIQRREGKGLRVVEGFSHGRNGGRGRRAEEKVVWVGIGDGDAGRGEGGRSRARNGARRDGGAGIVAWADGCGLSVELDVGAATFSLDAFCCLEDKVKRWNKNKRNGRTTRIAAVTRERGLDTLVTCLFGGGGARGRGRAFPSGALCREWLFIGMAFVDMSRKEIAGAGG